MNRKKLNYERGLGENRIFDLLNYKIGNTNPCHSRTISVKMKSKQISLESVENAVGYESVNKSDESVLEIFFNQNNKQ